MSHDDFSSFRELIGHVDKIKQKDNHPEFNRRPKKPHARKIEAQHARQLFYRKNNDDLSVNLDNLDANSFEAMITNRIKSARTIDLHGLFVDEAIRLLADKLSESRNSCLEYWIIVHGKGRNSPIYDRAPLKGAVLDFLLNHPRVAALTSLKDKDQRSGATMIAVHKKSIF